MPDRSILDKRSDVVRVSGRALRPTPLTAVLPAIVPVLMSLFMSTLAAGCASGLPHPCRVYPAYGTAVEARSVAAGQFGAHPVAFLSRAELDVTVACAPADSPGIAAILTPSGQRAWIPVDDLPARSIADCPPGEH